jgi:PAS domain S-box-containing protein
MAPAGAIFLPLLAAHFLMPNTIDLSQLVQVMGDALIVSDADGKIILWNPAAQRLFGYSEAEALGQNLDIITPERFRQRHWHGYHQSMKTGTTKYGTQTLRVPAVHKDGHTLSIAFTVAMLFDEHKAVAGVAAMIRDDTARFLEEKELKKQLQALAEKPKQSF